MCFSVFLYFILSYVRREKQCESESSVPAACSSVCVFFIALFYLSNCEITME